MQQRLREAREGGAAVSKSESDAVSETEAGRAGRTAGRTAGRVPVGRGNPHPYSSQVPGSFYFQYDVELRRKVFK